MPLTLDGTNGEVFPSWTTATRPATPSAGQTGFNTTTSALDVYDGTIWGSVSTSTGIPSGSVMPYAGSSAPTGWLLCSGAAVSRTTYAALFAVVGTTYGSGDGSTTFNLPDMRGRLAAGVDNMGGTAANRITAAGSGITGTTLGAAGGAEDVTLATSDIPSHEHPGKRMGGASGSTSYYSVTSNGSGTAFYDRTGFIQNTGGGTAHNNTQPTIMLNYIIKT
jgi:microcystin-dependent protein